MTHKPKRKQANWIVEEAGTESFSESALIVVHPLADINGISECCENLYTDDLKRVHIIFDNRTPPVQVSNYFRIIKTEMPNLEYVIKFAHPFTIALVGSLYKRMQAYCQTIKNRKVRQ